MVRDVVKANLTEGTGEAREPPYARSPQTVIIHRSCAALGWASVSHPHTYSSGFTSPHGMICHFLNLSEGKLSKVLFEGPIHTPAVSWT